MKLIKKIFKILLFLIFSFILIIIITIYSSKITSSDDISNLKKIRMFDSNNNVFYEINNLHESTYIQIDKISNEAIKTFIEIEDKRFYQHSGFDIYRIIKAVFNNIGNNTVIGASTITQQYVKNLYLSNEKTLLRKIKELYYAIKLESIYSKKEILEGYLNTIYFNHGIYGIYDASMYYFNKEPIDLSYAESATLAAIIKAPTTYAPDVDFRKNQKRKEVILKTLLDNSKITDEEYINSINAPIDITMTKYKKYPSTVLFYKDLVLAELDKINLKSNQIDIYTSFNTEINYFIDDYIKNNQIYSDLSIIVLNNEGEIVCSTSKDYYKNSYNTGIYSERMIGSTIKPMLYYQALKNGMNALSTFKSEPTTFYINKEPYTLKNYNDKYENKKITMGYAIATSDNIYSVKTHLYLGSDKLIKFLKLFDISIKEDYPSLALGTVSMTLEKLTEIYNTFSRLGKYSKSYTINKIHANNKEYYIKRKKVKQKLNENTTFILNELLTNTFDTNLNSNVNVTGNSIAHKINTKTAAKTGLTDYDSYIIGFTPKYTIGIWTGNSNNSLLTDLYSKQFPKQCFYNIVNQLSVENKNIWYDRPNGVYNIFTDPTGFNTGYKKNVYFLN